jgi:hypothetical protein
MCESLSGPLFQGTLPIGDSGEAIPELWRAALTHAKGRIAGLRT